MVMKVNGIAVVPDYYVGETGEIVKIRTCDIQSAIDNTDVTTFADNHSTNNGVVTGLTSSDNGMQFTSVVIDSDIEQKIKTIVGDGNIPNISAKLVPADGAEFTKYTENGNEYITADKWTIPHISLVERGRCSPEDGCGINDYTILNCADTPDGDIGMDTEKELEQLKNTVTELEATVGTLTTERDEGVLALSELKTTNESLLMEKETALKELKSAELVLSETEENLKTLELKDIQGIKKSILVLDADYELSGEESKDDLELILSVLRKTNTRMGANAEKQNNENDEIQDALNELRVATGRKA